MKAIPPEIRIPYDALLAKREIPEKYRYYSKKWLQYYLDFCGKYDFKQSDKEALPLFQQLAEALVDHARRYG